MRMCIVVLCLTGLISSAFGQHLAEQTTQGAPQSALDVTLDRFDVSDAVFRDGISELSLKGVNGLHLGFEEIIRGNIAQDPRALSPHFELHLKEKTVREVLNKLCQADSRYIWSQEGSTVNIYPRVTMGDPSYLFNQHIDRIMVTAAPDADHALSPLFKKFPEQQIGYFGPGLGSDAYSKPWTVAFEDLTVRQFINRVAEHMGDQTSWVWEGGKQERMFTFLKGGFHTFRPSGKQ